MANDSITTDQDEVDLDENLTPEQREARARLQKLIERQGAGPINFDDLLAKADFWPEDESVDEFIATIRRWRDEGGD
jgi:hypothetical protein